MLRIFKAKDELNIKNIDTLTADRLNSNYNRHGKLFPNTVRCIIIGSSACGKSNVAFNMLTQPNGLFFNSLYIFSKSLNQPKYLLLKKILSDVPEVGCFMFDNNEDVIAPEKAIPYSVFLFDDISCEKHNNIRKYYTMGRHNNIDSIYIGQSYSKIPKQLIRDNCNFLVVFKQDERNLRHIYNDHVSPDCSFDTFKEVCAQAWKNKYDFMVISKDDPINNGRYRIGFDKFLLLS